MSSGMANGFQIGKVAKATGLTVDTIRFYQRIGLVKAPTRTSSGYRVFCEPDVEDLQFIGKAQQLGFSLTEIKDLLLLRRNTAHACPEVRDLIRLKLRNVQEKIAALQQVHCELNRALRKCNRVFQKHAADDCCPVLAELERTKARRASG